MRIKLKKSSLLIKVIVAIVIIYGMVTLIYLQRQISATQRECETVEAEKTQVLQENAALNENLEKLDTDEGTEEVAREKLGLVTEGEITFYDVGD